MSLRQSTEEKGKGKGLEEVFRGERVNKKVLYYKSKARVKESIYKWVSV